MENNALIDDAVEVFKILGDKTRVKILLIIDKEETCVLDLVNALDISQPAISQHLRKMRRLGFVQESKSGKWSYYKTDKNNFMYFLLKDILSKISISE
ncbi:MAG: metalloregulator ArsR/SmtB family transcription factor [Clostridia bacterium]|nr:metalloregulator ArsR/SmtB family transcription factor [Clostridia bacterium]